MEYSFNRKGRGSRKQESNIVSKVIRPRHDTINTRIFQANRQSHGEKPYHDSRPEFEVGRRHTYANDRRYSKELEPPLKASNIVVARDHARSHRQYGRQPVQSRQSLPFQLPHEYRTVDPRIFRHDEALHNSRHRHSIASSGSGSSRGDDLPLPVEKILPKLPVLLPVAPAPCSSSCNVLPIVPPTGLRNFKHKLFTQFCSDANSEEDLKEIPRAPTTQMMEVQLSYVMARQHESSAMLSLQMDGIRESIEKELENLSPNRGEALTPEAVFHLFDMCEYLKLSDPVKYTAVEIYDRFMMAFSTYMTDQLMPLDKQTTIESHQRLKVQAQLRLASCVQLASKMVADVTSDALSSNAIYNALNFQTLFTVKHISASELRILSLIKYKTNYVTTLDIIEILLIQLELDIPLYRRIYELCVFLLDYVLEDHQSVYNCLFKLESERQPTLDREQFRKIEFNKLVEASGIVACCVYAFKQSEYKIYQHAISSITKVNESTFTDLAAILLKNTTDQSLWPGISLC